MEGPVPQFVIYRQSVALRERNAARDALHTIRAFAEQRMAEGTREHADMQHIANIAKEAA